ncbi:MAG TPA: tetratricopeptide repeat protein [Symbiobacteriaceae bacterium]|jgi:protein O-GlcNAc transferase|nr:tetratricopeptide repeat protein [Symbiobacteriaceae bacterium]
MENEVLAQMIKEADAQFARGAVDEALREYQAILEQDSSVAWAHSRVGAILAQKGNLEEAEQSLLKALEFDSELPQAHSNLGNIHYTRGNFDQAVERYQIATKLDPANPLYHQNLHAAYKRQKKYAEAVKSLKQSHKLTRETSVKNTKAEFQSVKRRFGCTSVIAILLLLTGAMFVIAYAI